MRLIPSKLDASVLYSEVIKSYWYVDIFPLRRNTSFVAIRSLNTPQYFQEGKGYEN